jgi:hypothetical protein
MPDRKQRIVKQAMAPNPKNPALTIVKNGSRRPAPRYAKTLPTCLRCQAILLNKQIPITMNCWLTELTAAIEGKRLRSPEKRM